MSAKTSHIDAHINYLLILYSYSLGGYLVMGKKNSIVPYNSYFNQDSQKGK